MSVPEVKSPLRVLFATIYDPEHPHSFSGAGRSILLALRDNFDAVHTTGPLRFRRGWRRWANGVFKLIGYPRRYDPARTLANGKFFAEQVQSRVDETRPDVIVSQGERPIAFLDTDIPIVNWTDAVWASLDGYYPKYTNMMTDTKRAADIMERRALERSAITTFQTEFPVAFAREVYGYPIERTRVIPFGANLDPMYSDADIKNIVDARLTDECRLLFVGLEWDRKRAQFAVDAAADLVRRGLTCRLSLVGCNPPSGWDKPRWVDLLGFVSKTTPEGIAKLRQLYSGSHFLVLPTIAEMGANVFSEACAFGVPSLAPATGGIPTIIRQDVNGHLFPVEATPSDYADYVERIWHDRQAWRRLCLRAFREYAERLNWRVAGKSFRQVVEEAYEECRATRGPTVSSQ